MFKTFRIFIGYDKRETIAYHVLSQSIMENSSVPVSITPIKLEKLKKFYSLEGEILDWGIAVYFPGPKSFTGESVLELHCHGSPVVTSSIINEIVTCGARFAGPGEFSKRAFINEKLDLVQAEAVSDLISSQTEKSAKAAIRSMTGEFTKAVELQKEKLALQGTQGTTIIQDNSQTTSNSSAPLVLPTQPISPGNGQSSLQQD